MPLASALKRVPSKSPTKYCTPLPPHNAPWLTEMNSTQRVPVTRPSSARMGSSTRSGTSQMLLAAEPAGPKVDARVQSLRLADVYSHISCRSAATTSITQRCVGACQKTLGSRNSVDWMSMIGLPAYGV